MIEAVLIFGLITAIGEVIILLSLPPWVRQKIVYSSFLANMLHLSFAALNRWIHWGTITGSMTAVMAYVVSTVVVSCFKWLYYLKGAHNS